MYRGPPAMAQARRSAILTPQEYQFMQDKLAAGVPLSSVARMLGRTVDDLRRGVIVPEVVGEVPKRSRETPSHREQRLSLEEKDRRSTTWRP